MAFDDLPQIHPREQKVNAASIKAHSDLLGIRAEYELTDIEYLGILTEIMQSCMKYALRVERHGNEDKPSGLV